mgnify:CR=1 FL=1
MATETDEFLAGLTDDDLDRRVRREDALGNVWAFPSKTMPYDRTLQAMRGTYNLFGFQ